MCLSLALVTVSSPSECVGANPTRFSFPTRSRLWASRQRQDISLALDQAIRPWCFAEDLGTLNHAAARLLDLTVGAVRPHILEVVLLSPGVLSIYGY